MTIIRGQKSVGMTTTRVRLPTLPLPQESPSSADIIAELQNRLVNLETLVEGKADSSKIRTLIAYSDEAVLIKAKDIVLAGDVTIAKIINEQNGTTSGEVPVSITRIIGNRVQTGQLLSNNWGPSAGSYISLDDGVIIMGGSDAPALYYEAGDIFMTGTLNAGSIITSSVTVDGVTLGTIKGNASTGAGHAGVTGGNPHGTSMAQIAGDLDDIADGSSYFKSTASQNAGGTRAVNALDGSYDYIRTISTQKIVVSGSNPSNGIMFDVNGLRTYAAGSPTFTLNSSNGSAFFGGDIETSGRVIARGGNTFSGIIAAMHAIAGSIGGAGLYANSGSGTTAISADTTTGWAVLAKSTSGTAVEGRASGSGGIGVEAENTTGGVALNIPAGYIARPKSASAGVLEMWDTATNTSQGKFYYEFRQAA